MSKNTQDPNEAIKLKDLFINAPETQIDKVLRDKIMEWPDNPSALQILEVLDQGVHGSLCSAFVINLLDIVYKKAIHIEGTTHEEVVKKATWRK